VVEGSGRAVRGAHAKTFGVVKAEVQILRACRGIRAGDLPPSQTATVR